MEKPQSWTQEEGKGQQKSPEKGASEPIRELGPEEERILKETLARVQKSAANDNEETSEEDLAA